MLMGLYSLECVIGTILEENGELRAEGSAWYQKEHATFSDILRIMRLAIWKENLISRKGKITPSGENIPLEMEGWIESIVQQVLQAA